MRIMGETGTLRDVQIEVVDGFSSKAFCEQAGSKIAHTLVSHVGQHKKGQGIPVEIPSSAPAIQFDCLPMVK